jgi:hypothetical protein
VFFKVPLSQEPLRVSVENRSRIKSLESSTMHRIMSEGDGRRLQSFVDTVGFHTTPIIR